MERNLQSAIEKERSTKNQASRELEEWKTKVRILEERCAFRETLRDLSQQISQLKEQTDRVKTRRQELREIESERIAEQKELVHVKQLHVQLLERLNSVAHDLLHDIDWRGYEESINPENLKDEELEKELEHQRDQSYANMQSAQNDLQREYEAIAEIERENDLIIEETKRLAEAISLVTQS